MQVALITGGSAGIGRAAALEIARSGVGVVLTYRRHAAEAMATVAEIEAAGGTAAALPLDIGDLASFDGFAERVAKTLRDGFGVDRLRHLVNNAGVGGGAPFGEVSEELFDDLHRTLFRGPYFLTQRLLPLLEDGGTIVNTGSTSALDTGIEAGYSAYAAQKAAVHVLTRVWAKELAPRRIRVNAVAPGTTRTRIGDDVFERMPELVAQWGEQAAFGRIGEPEDVGRVIAFLVGDASAWVTGQVVEVSGGQGL
ncbi:SDR family NAD(P)-dependent oxidoreductase [Nocardioides sp. T2.26MG-1]|uniref:SDR family NAD(P)-dependent oxidoreductase n=1 Tax=Nocardioides sp. T2.26MG-1 TaxID=3041166 RepID=UPI002477C1E4|nr:SDR family oxidoreductase [Nocardioides sp. T2.26MG-1]CAI9400640.1 General stress protein 39 [Nocardioides sp. T2.26MG-1]